MTRCIGITGRLFGHRYEARHSVSTRKVVLPAKAPGDFVSIKGAVPRDFEKRTYHGDVCARCGAVVNNPEGRA